MADNVNVWSKVAVAVQTVLGAAKTITAITKASPAVASSTAHGFVVGDMVLLKVAGMLRLNYAVKRVGTVPTVDSFSLEGVDSTLYDTFTSGTAEKITFGAACSTLKDISVSGGEVKPIDITTIHDDEDREQAGNRSATTYEFDSLWMPNDAALKQLAIFDDTKTVGCLEIKFATGDKLYFASSPSCNLAPQGSSGNAVTTKVSFRLKGRITNYAAA